MQPADDLTGLIYDAALDTSLWPSLLERVADLVHGGPAALLFQNQITMQGSGVSTRIDPAILPTYFEHFASRNPLTAKNELPAAGADPTSVITDEFVIAKPDLMRTEYYNDFMAPNGIHSLLMIAVAVKGQTAATINIGRSTQGAVFGEEEIRLSRTIQPHLVRSFRLALQLTEARQTNGALLEFLDSSPHGLFLIGADGRVRHANRAGEAVLGDGLRVVNGELVAAQPEASRILRRAVMGAVASGAQRVGASLSVARPSLRRPLSIIVAPLNRDTSSLVMLGPVALVCVTDPDAGVALPERRLRDLFGLTGAEAKVALEILAGRDTKSAAATLSLSVHTVRVHLARILDKTRTNRQAELVQLMMKVVGMGAG